MSKLTNEDIDKLSAMMIVFIHAAEKCIYITEHFYSAYYRASQDYQKLVSKYGPAGARMIVDKVSGQVLHHNTKRLYKEIIKQTERLKYLIGRVSDLAIAGATQNSESVTGAEAYDALDADVKFLCELFAHCANCSKDDEMKVLSYAKLCGKDKSRISEELINAFIS